MLNAYISSRFDGWAGMCVDAARDTYIADCCNHCIRKPTPKLVPVAPPHHGKLTSGNENNGRRELAAPVFGWCVYF